ncbi:hypothetical protein G647_01990 [Cladophialophora carrionii CBS 160.54]|uniref:Calcineurin-like phosphoesterase domain-containing protein n=1 Tax=Cladophialophora carrionii CBS 160.54 TaxID=1279043 RepID=V9DU47_9EURO|nr:uncharacterized protein G647_01990 [Cladophialophora carrionii CBS 160.54]ETI29537.1 hypothetical protein G647_01990 [Cladophialophora carrionii CBS 160.54]
MYKYGVADRSLRFLLPVALCLTIYLYLYPLFHGCVFPATDGSTTSSLIDTVRRHLPIDHAIDTSSNSLTAPFRLLALADPQLEGDSSLPKPDDAFIPTLRRRWAHLPTTGLHNISPFLELAREVVFQDVPEALGALRKRIDLFGNDYYLGHIYRTLHWWTQPTHVAVLGDLIGSQWVTDAEFEWRGWRFWNRVFAKGHRVEDDITLLDGEEQERIFELGDASWTTRTINIAGNHDIGYAGDISRTRMDRFERVFGKANWDVRFQYPRSNATLVTPEVGATSHPSLHLIVLNSLILDGPALSDDLRSETFDYLNGLINHRLRPVEDRSSFTLLLTHLPLHKKEGTCVDAPFFDYWPDDDGGGVYKPHGMREQNHLSEEASHRGTLQALFGMTGDRDAPAQGKGRNGLIVTGHDHEGCDTWHFVPADSAWSTSEDQHEDKRETLWDVSKWEHANQATSHTGVREVTLRSMMGDYGGNAGLLSAWFDQGEGEWKYEIRMCGLDIKMWWAVHVIDLVVLGLSLFSLFTHSLHLHAGSGTGSRAVASPRDVKTTK